MQDLNYELPLETGTSHRNPTCIYSSTVDMLVLYRTFIHACALWLAQYTQNLLLYTF